MTPEELKARFPYMFAGPNISLAFERGWMAILVEACERIDAVLGADKRSFSWVQIKEKYGSARFYFALDSDLYEPVYLQVNAIAKEAETKTEVACIECGAPATLEQYGASWMVVCPLHEPEDRPRFRL